MFEKKFGKKTQFVVVQAQEEARALGSPTVEAEHLLLALARRTGDPAAAALAEAGLDHTTVTEALETERDETLAAVGVSVSAFDLPPVAPAKSRPGWGTSAKLSLERALHAAGERGERGIEPAHLLLGVLLAEAGTVPRALARAGVVPAELERRTRLALDAAA
jgi:ATP-dependent Clp protease ATP-binding subunit ClpA